MKQLILSIFMFYILNNCIAQDTLIYKNGVVDIVQILDITDSSVKYKSWKDTSDVKIYYKSYPIVKQIKYNNGQKIVLKKFKHYKYKVPNIMRHNISIDLWDINRKLLTISYQYSFPKNNNLTMRVLASTSFNQISNSNEKIDYSSISYYSKDKIFSTGIGLMIHPFSEVNTGLSLGISYEAGIFKDLVYEGTYPNHTEIVKNIFFSNFLFGIGYYGNILPHFAIGIYGDLGTSQYDEDNFGARFRVKCGYTF